MRRTVRNSSGSSMVSLSDSLRDGNMFEAGGNDGLLKARKQENPMDVAPPFYVNVYVRVLCAVNPLSVLRPVCTQNFR